MSGFGSSSKSHKKSSKEAITIIIHPGQKVCVEAKKKSNEKSNKKSNKKSHKCGCE